MIPPPFNWIPPEWNGTGKPDLSTDPNNQTNAPTFTNPDQPLGPGGTPKLNGGDDLKARAEALILNTTKFNNHFVALRNLEPTANNETGPNLTKVPHPESDFRHVDPGFNAAPILAAITTLKGLKGQASKDGEADNAFKKALPPMLDLEEMISPNPRGMRRLKLASDHTLVRVIILFGEINVALKNNNKADYNKARDEYIEMLTDLDDREPDTTSPGKKGYGRSLQWFYIRPIIHTDDPKDPTKPALIKGAVVQAKWNPHVSSSGIPVAHS